MQMPKPLHGKRVLDLSQYISGPSCGALLADFGAEVTKVESAAGDPNRRLQATTFGSIYTRAFNTGKSSIAIDLRDPAGREDLEPLLAGADAMIVNFGPAALRKLDLTWPAVHQRHPRLIMTSITGYGLADDRTCFDTIAQCECGYAHLNADRDGTPRVGAGWPVDVISGMYAGFATAMALCATAVEGILIDVSMLEAAVAAFLPSTAILALEGGQVPAGTGNADRAAAPCNIYPCADGHVYIYGGLDGHWQALRSYVGGPDISLPDRLARAQELDALVASWTRDQPARQVLETVEGLGIPAGIVAAPADAFQAMMRMREGAVARVLSSGEAVPAFPALFCGLRPHRSAAPVIGGSRRKE